MKSSYKVVRVHHIPGRPFDNKARVMSTHYTAAGANKHLKIVKRDFTDKTNLKVVYDWQPKKAGDTIIVI